MISFACSGCGRTLRVPDQHAGKRARCPGCQARTAVPAAPGRTAAASEDITLPPAPSRPAQPTGGYDQPTLGPGPTSPAPALVPGYDILGELGRGGMGVVYKARQHRPRRLVALKMVLAGEHASADALARFRREAEAIAKLSHPGIVAVHEVGEHHGRPFFTLELVEGGNLADLLRKGRLAPREAAELLLQMARAVEYAHKRGVLHRDLKPANVLLAAADDREDGPRYQAKLTDFGLAKQMGEMATAAAGPRTASGAVMGTPAYMAPEQASGKSKELGPALDIYSLGAILYEMLAGRPPFEAATLLDTLLKVATEEPTPLRQLRPDLPRDLETICHKCLAKAPADRYRSARLLAVDLQRFLAGDPILARPPGRLARLRRRLARNKALLYAGGSAVLAACLSIGVLALWPRGAKAPSGPKVAAQAPDLRLVPRRGFGLISVRVADLWGRPETARLLKETKALPREMPDLDAASKMIAEQLSLSPADVERVTLFVRSFDTVALGAGAAPPGEGALAQHAPALVALTKRAYDFAKLRKAVENMTGGLARREHNGRALFCSGQGDNGVCLCPVEERVLLVGTTAGVKHILDTSDQPDADGPLDDALAQVEQGAPIVVAFRPPPDSVDAMLKSKLFAGLPLEPLKGAQLVTLALRAQPPTEGRFIPDLDLDVSVRFGDEAQAGRALDAARRALDRLLAEAEREARAEGASVFIEPPLRAVRAAKWEQVGPSLRLPIRARWDDKDLAPITAFIQEQTGRDQSAENLYKIGSALHQYSLRHGGLPPAVITSPKGEPLYSWRVAILPFTEHAADYRGLNQARPWDDPANKALLDKRPALYATPGEKRPTHTSYLALVGADAALDRAARRPLNSFTDGTSNTLLVAEAAASVHWAAPTDLPFAKGKRPAVGGPFTGVFHGLMANGHVFRFPRGIPDETLTALATRQGGETVNTFTFPLVKFGRPEVKMQPVPMKKP